MEALGERTRLALLGNWRLEIDGQARNGPAYNKGRALLAYLAVLGQPQSREQLSVLFWPDAGGHLRRILSNLRATLELGNTLSCLRSEKGLLGIDPCYPLWLDVAAFNVTQTCHADAATAHCAQCLRTMENQAALYRGEFMAGFSLPDCQEFEDWLHRQRETLRCRMLTLLERLWQCHERNGRPDKALIFASRYVEMEPWNETGQRNLMRLLALNGQTAAALSQFEACRRLLNRELGVGPEWETRTMLERIRAGSLDFAASEPPSNLRAPLNGIHNTAD